MILDHHKVRGLFRAIQQSGRRKFPCALNVRLVDVKFKNPSENCNLLYVQTSVHQRHVKANKTAPTVYGDHNVRSANVSMDDPPVI